MNTQLYNQLVQAQNFFNTLNRYDEALIAKSNAIIRAYGKPKKFTGPLFWFLLFVCWPALIYYCFFHNYKYKNTLKLYDKCKTYEQFFEEIKNKSGADYQVKSLIADAEKISAEYARYFNDNYSCIEFLPYRYKSFNSPTAVKEGVELLDHLIRFVKDGAKTQNEAFNRYYAYLKREKELEKQWNAELAEERWKREQENQRHKEQMDAYNKLIDTQQKLYNEIYARNHRGY